MLDTFTSGNYELQIEYVWSSESIWNLIYLFMSTDLLHPQLQHKITYSRPTLIQNR